MHLQIGKKGKYSTFYKYEEPKILDLIWKTGAEVQFLKIY